MPKRKSKKLWRIDYLDGNIYRAKFVNANTENEAIKKSKIKDPIDVQIEKEEEVDDEEVK